jgi:hypothetical protein
VRDGSADIVFPKAPIERNGLGKFRHFRFRPATEAAAAGNWCIFAHALAECLRVEPGVQRKFTTFTTPWAVNLRAHCVAARYIQQVNRPCLILLSSSLLIGCGKKEQSKNLLTNNNSGNPITAPVDYLGAVSQARKTAIGRIDIASLQNAINLFNGQEDRYPRDLNELVQQRCIQAIPQLPAGSRYAYNPQTGEIRIIRQ